MESTLPTGDRTQYTVLVYVAALSGLVINLCFGSFKPDSQIDHIVCILGSVKCVLIL